SAVGLSPTPADTTAINADTIPPALMDADLLHPNANGYKAMATGVHSAIVARGWTGVLPVPAAPSVGVNDYSYRFVASRSTTPADSAIASLNNEVEAGTDLVQAVSTKQPLLRRTANDAWVDFDGTDDVLALPSFSPSGGVTVAILARVQSTAFTSLVNLSNSGGLNIQMVSQPQVGTAKLDLRAGTDPRLGLSDTTKNPGDGAWHLLVGVFNGASSIVAFDTVATSGSIGAGLANRLSFGDTNMGGLGGVPTNYDVAEILVYNRALTSAEITGTLFPAVKANHPTLMP
ncbi:MAG: LamG-like jellyroll fold domain-containing protein, partial [Micrococcaceae bacterium]|nr:LamG-like jellyroll fold domain-containing protein [Micrococcaceae bacterium]